MHIKILILNWNRKELLKCCIDSVLKIDYCDYSVMVIDNASTDGSIEMVNQNYSDVECLILDQNYGFSGAYNRCFKKLDSNKTQFIMLLNNDTEVDRNILKGFNDARLKYGNNHIYGGKIYYHNDRTKIWYAGGNYNLKWFYIGHRGIRKMDSPQYSNNKETMYVTGCCLFTSMNVINKLGGFDEQFNMYGEDVDLCFRANKEDIKCYFCPEAFLWHHVSASIGGRYSIKKIISKIFSYYKITMKYYKS